MKRLKLSAAILAIVSYAGSPLLAEDLLPIRNCTWCHGASALGLWGSPRLAGQRPEYVENQIMSFKNHTRDNPVSRQYMWAAAAALTPQMAHDLANYFSTLPAKAADDGDPALADAGRTIYEEGDGESNIVACIVCHGPNGEGVREIPRLGGLAYSYLKRRLVQWGEGYHAAAAPMPQIANKLSPDEISAIASYLSFIR